MDNKAASPSNVPMQIFFDNVRITPNEKIYYKTSKETDRDTEGSVCY